MVSVADLIEEQPRRPIAVGDQYVRVAIIVEVAEGRPAAYLEQLKAYGGIICDLDKSPPSIVVEELVRLTQRIGIALTHQLRQQLYSSVDDQQIEPAIVVIVKERRAKTCKTMPGHSQTCLARTVFKKGFTQIHVKRVRLVHQVGDKDVFGAIAVEISRIHTHAGLCLSISVDGGAGQERVVLKRPVLLVNPELIGITIVGDVNVCPAVTIKIGGDHTQSVAELFVHACADSDVFKCTVAFVMKQAVAGRAKNAWCAIVLRAGGGVTGGTVSRGKIRVVHYHQIKPAIPIIVEEGGARPPAWIIRPSFLCDFGKRPITFVQVHLVSTEVCNIQIGTAVVIDVADCDAHPVSVGHDAALFGYIGELECPAAVFADHEVVAEEPAAR